MSEPKQTAIIYKWNIERNGPDSFFLVGRIIDHPRVGTIYGHTGTLKSINFETMTAETANTTWTLKEYSS